MKKKIFYAGLMWVEVFSVLFLSCSNSLITPVKGSIQINFDEMPDLAQYCTRSEITNDSTENFYYEITAKGSDYNETQTGILDISNDDLVDISLIVDFTGITLNTTIKLSMNLYDVTTDSDEEETKTLIADGSSSVIVTDENTTASLVLSAYTDSSGLSWITVGEADFSAGATGYETLVLDSNDVPYVAYEDEKNNWKATVVKYNDDSNSWETVGSAGFSAGVASYISLVIDSTDTLYIAYKDCGNAGKATVMEYDNDSDSWETVGSTGFSAGVALYETLALDSNDIPYIAYLDEANDYKATVMKYEDSSWTTVGSAGFSADEADYISLALDSNDMLYIAYLDDANDYKATVMKYEDESWETVGSAGFSAGAAGFESLALDSNDMPYVVYEDVANDYKATVMKYEDGSWETVGDADFSDGEARYESLALDSTDTPYIAYEDVANDEKVTVMKYQY